MAEENTFTLTLKEIIDNGYPVLRNLDYLGRCYNMLTVDPLDLGNSAIDTQAVAFTHYQPLADGTALLPLFVRYTPMSGGQYSARTSLIDTTHRYKSTFSQDVSIEASSDGGPLGLGPKYSFSCSTSYKKSTSGSSQERRMTTYTRINAPDYALTLPEDLKSMAITAEFRAAVLALPNDVDANGAKAAYYAFFDEFGTHYSRQVVFGGRLYQVMTMRYSSYQKLVEKDVKVSVAAEGSFMGYTGKGSSDTAKSSMNEVQKIASETRTDIRYIGGRPLSDFDAWVESIAADPAPIGMKLRPLAELFTSDLFSGVNNIADRAHAFNTFLPEYLEEMGDYSPPRYVGFNDRIQLQEVESREYLIDKAEHLGDVRIAGVMLDQNGNHDRAHWHIRRIYDDEYPGDPRYVPIGKEVWLLNRHMNDNMLARNNTKDNPNLGTSEFEYLGVNGKDDEKGDVSRWRLLQVDRDETWMEGDYLSDDDIVMLQSPYEVDNESQYLHLRKQMGLSNLTGSAGTMRAMPQTMAVAEPDRKGAALFAVRIIDPAISYYETVQLESGDDEYLNVRGSAADTVTGTEQGSKGGTKWQFRPHHQSEALDGYVPIGDDVVALWSENTRAYLSSDEENHHGAQCLKTSTTRRDDETTQWTLELVPGDEREQNDSPSLRDGFKVRLKAANGTYAVIDRQNDTDFVRVTNKKNDATVWTVKRLGR